MRGSPRNTQDSEVPNDTYRELLKRTLFQRGDFRLASGRQSNFKIECDALSSEDWATLAMLLAERLPAFGDVEGVPAGGERLAFFLTQYVTEGPLLIVDDVWTTGGSWERCRGERDAIGAVVFAREQALPEVTVLFQMAPVKKERDKGWTN